MKTTKTKKYLNEQQKVSVSKNSGFIIIIIGEIICHNVSGVLLNLLSGYIIMITLAILFFLTGNNTLEN